MSTRKAGPIDGIAGDCLLEGLAQQRARHGRVMEAVGDPLNDGVFQAVLVENDGMEEPTQRRFAVDRLLRLVAKALPDGVDGVDRPQSGRLQGGGHPISILTRRALDVPRPATPQRRWRMSDAGPMRLGYGAGAEEKSSAPMTFWRSRNPRRIRHSEKRGRDEAFPRRQGHGPDVGRIRVAVVGAVGRIEIENAGRHNAVSLAMWQAIPDAVAELDVHPDVRLIVVTGGGGGAFASGADITEFDTVRADAVYVGRLRGGQCRRLRRRAPRRQADGRRHPALLHGRRRRPRRGLRRPHSFGRHRLRHSGGAARPRLSDRCGRRPRGADRPVAHQGPLLHRQADRRGDGAPDRSRRRRGGGRRPRGARPPPMRPGSPPSPR